MKLTNTFIKNHLSFVKLRIASTHKSYLRFSDAYFRHIGIRKMQSTAAESPISRMKQNVKKWSFMNNIRRCYELVIKTNDKCYYCRRRMMHALSLT